jgi:hypothetical protein
MEVSFLSFDIAIVRVASDYGVSHRPPFVAAALVVAHAMSGSPPDALRIHRYREGVTPTLSDDDT